MRYHDWGERSPRWSGIRSASVRVGSVRTHYLRADGEAGSRPGAPAHLLVHSVGAGGIFMLDLIRPLGAYGPVVAPDLQGTMFGHTDTPQAGAARIGPNAAFLRDFTDALGLGRVILHGWSFGGAVALRFAATSPDRVERLVLANPPLPVPLTPLQRFGWQTLGRLALLVGPVLARGLVRVWGRRAIEAKMANLEQAALDRFGTLGGDPSRIAADNIKLWIDQLADLRAHPGRMGYAITAFASVVSWMFVDQRPALEAIDRVTAPVLLLWGEEDPLIARPTIDRALARRPDWDLHVFASAGHAAPLEVPGEYVEVVGRWLGEAPGRSGRRGWRE